VSRDPTHQPCCTAPWPLHYRDCITEPRCDTCHGAGLVDSEAFVPEAPGWAPESKPCPDCAAEVKS
jgi:hypothetical protein